MGKKRTIIDKIKGGWKELDYRKLNILIKTQIDGMHLIALHGACSLAIRNTELPSRSRKLLKDFMTRAEKALKEVGAMTEKDIEAINDYETGCNQHKDN